jgi:hypothetical protein
MTSVVYFYEYDYNLWVSVVYAFAFRLVFAVLVSAFIIVSTVNSCFQGRQPSRCSWHVCTTFNGHVGTLLA